MYYPSSQLKTNLYTNGEEYVLSTTLEPYKGYYYEVSNGKKYTGKTPQDGPNTLIIFPPSSENQSPDNITGTYFYQPSLTNTVLPVEVPPVITTETNTPLAENYKVPPSPNRFLPVYNPNAPTQKDYNLGVFQRYFCKKNNELKYIEIDQKTYNLFQSRNPTVAWDLYTSLYTLWYLKGNKEQIYKTNKGLILLIEQKEKWYGFSQYFKEDFSKYYLES